MVTYQVSKIPLVTLLVTMVTYQVSKIPIVTLLVTMVTYQVSKIPLILDEARHHLLEPYLLL